MATKFGLYKNKIFMLDINNNKIELTSNNIVNKNIGFQEYVDVLGNSHSDILIKNIDEEVLEFAYELGNRWLLRRTG